MTNYPTSLDTFTNPTPNNTLDNPSHSEQHSNLNDSVEALQTKVGIDSSTDTNSIDYKVNNIVSSKVLQTVFTSYSTQATNTTDVLADTGLSLTITPSSTSSKIMLFVRTGELRAQEVDSGIQTVLLRGATQIAEITKYASYPSANREYASIAYQDSPATTSAITYKTQFKRNVGTGTVSHCEANSLSTMLAIEVID